MTQAGPIAQKPVAWGLLAIVALMPFHAFLSVWLGHLTGHQAVWQSWKDILAVALAVGAACLVWQNPRLLRRYMNPLGYTIAAFLSLALLITAIMHPDWRQVLFGLKIDIEFYVVFLVALIVATRKLELRMTQIIMVTSGIVIGFGLMQIFVLPDDFLTRFGYGIHTIAPFLTVDPILHTVRILSTLGGPNQLGAFLILPLCLVWNFMLRRPRFWHSLLLLGGGVVMWHTFSRSAWLGLAAGLIIVTLLSIPRKWRLPSLLVLTFASAIAVQVAIQTAASNPKLQFYLLHQGLAITTVKGSTDLHSQANAEGMRIIREHPAGKGLGAAGPASFHSNHPTIPESYYIQMAIETGLVGLALYLATQVLAGVSLLRRLHTSSAALGVFGALVGVGVVNIFLHGWADSSTALVFWAYAGVVVGAES